MFQQPFGCVWASDWHYPAAITTTVAAPGVQGSPSRAGPARRSGHTDYRLRGREAGNRADGQSADAAAYRARAHRASGAGPVVNPGRTIFLHIAEREQGPAAKAAQGGQRPRCGRRNHCITTIVIRSLFKNPTTRGLVRCAARSIVDRTGTGWRDTYTETMALRDQVHEARGASPTSISR
jgi:hypothetical protein